MFENEPKADSLPCWRADDVAVPSTEDVVICASEVVPPPEDQARRIATAALQATADYLARQEAARYTGHGANTGGLQGHSVGSDYPYTIIGVADRLDAPTQWQVMDTRTGNRGTPRRTYREADIDLASLKLRNLMHS